MSTYTLPQASKIPSLPAEEITSVLSHLFEPSPTLATLCLPLLSSTSFENYDDIIAAVRVQLLSLRASDLPSDQQRLLSILGSHPRLGAKKVDSSHSRDEQKSLQEGGGEEEAERLRMLNEEYEGKFPGMRYVVFVAGRPRSVIMENMRERIDRGDIEEEKLEAINAMADIAKDRASKLQGDQ